MENRREAYYIWFLHGNSLAKKKVKEKNESGEKKVKEKNVKGVDSGIQD